MTITGYNTELNSTATDKAISDLVARMITCPDVNGNPINVTVSAGLDTLLNDALNGAQPPADQMPCIRIFAQTEQHPIESMGEQTDVLESVVLLNIYFLYNYDPSMDFNFEQYRRAHIRTNRQWLEEWNGFVPNMANDGWQFNNPQTITTTHTNALRNLIGGEEQISFAEGFYASRMDVSILVNEVVQF